MRLRSCVSAPLSVEVNEALVPKEEFVVFAPKPKLGCWEDVLPKEPSVEPLFEPSVTVEPELGSAFKPGVEAVLEAPPNADFCCPNAPNPDWPVPGLAKLEKPAPPPGFC